MHGVRPLGPFTLRRLDPPINTTCPGTSTDRKEMKVELIYCTPDPEAHIGEQASECYDSKTGREACIKRAAHCVDSGHLATLRFAYATVRISGISRVCSHQLVRVAHAGILQRSQRYVAETSVEYINPPAYDALPENVRNVVPGPYGPRISLLPM